MSDRPKTSNADEWALWLDEWKNANPAFIAVQIAEAIEEQTDTTADRIEALEAQLAEAEARAIRLAEMVRDAAADICPHSIKTQSKHTT